MVSEAGDSSVTLGHCVEFESRRLILGGSESTRKIVGPRREYGYNFGEDVPNAN